MPYRKMDEEAIDRLFTVYVEEGSTINQAAEALSVSVGTVRRYLEKFGWLRSRKKGVDFPETCKYGSDRICDVHGCDWGSTRCCYFFSTRKCPEDAIEPLELSQASKEKKSDPPAKKPTLPVLYQKLVSCSSDGAGLVIGSRIFSEMLSTVGLSPSSFDDHLRAMIDLGWVDLLRVDGARIVRCVQHGKVTTQWVHCEQWICTICGESVKSKEDIEIHEKKHTLRENLSSLVGLDVIDTAWPKLLGSIVKARTSGLSLDHIRAFYLAYQIIESLVSRAPTEEMGNKVRETIWRVVCGPDMKGLE